MNLTATRGQAFQCKHVFYKAVLAALLPFVYQKPKRETKEKYDYQMGEETEINLNCERKSKYASSDKLEYTSLNQNII